MTWMALSYGGLEPLKISNNPFVRVRGVTFLNCSLQCDILLCLFMLVVSEVALYQRTK